VKSGLKLEIRAAREQQKKQGYFDGRFSPRSHKDKKKEAAKKMCRGSHKRDLFSFKK
jgi:hypothetical protein